MRERQGAFGKHGPNRGEGGGNLPFRNQKKHPKELEKLVNFDDQPGEESRAGQQVGKPFGAKVAIRAIPSRNTVGKSRPSGPPIN